MAEAASEEQFVLRYLAQFVGAPPAQSADEEHSALLREWNAPGFIGSLLEL